MRAWSIAKHNALPLVAGVMALLFVLAAAAWAFQPWQPAAVRPNVTPQQDLAAYSWEELAAISSEIGACETEADALRAAASYNLRGEGGSAHAMGTKALELADGRQVRVELAGVWHDERSDGGKAGLTFAFADSACEHAMNHAFESKDGVDADSVGGWQASDMRAWLNGDFLNEFPADLRNRIVSVQKRTANRVGVQDELDEAGRLAGSSQDWLSETSDKLWLFSVAELCGDVPANADLGIDSTMTPIYGAEGAQYQLFADAGVSAFSPNELLVRSGNGVASTSSSNASLKPCTWWLRTKTLEFGNGFWFVGTDGTPLNGLGEDARILEPSYVPDEVWGPDHARGVVVGFCL